MTPPIVDEKALNAFIKAIDVFHGALWGGLCRADALREGYKEIQAYLAHAPQPDLQKPYTLDDLKNCSAATGNPIKNPDMSLPEIFSITVRELDGSEHVEDYIPKVTLHKLIAQMEGLRAKPKRLGTITYFDGIYDCIELVRGMLS